MREREVERESLHLLLIWLFTSVFVAFISHRRTAAKCQWCTSAQDGDSSVAAFYTWRRVRGLRSTRFKGEEREGRHLLLDGLDINDEEQHVNESGPPTASSRVGAQHDSAPDWRSSRSIDWTSAADE